MTKDAAQNPLAAGLPCARLKRAILGARYELSVAFLRAPAMRVLNRTYRKRDASTDILSFSIAPDMGELVFSAQDVRRRAPAFGMNARAYFAYLFVHGCLHLKGLEHGRRMDSLERKYCEQFGIRYPANSA